MESRWPHTWNWLPVGESALAVSSSVCFFKPNNIVLPFGIKEQFFTPVDKAAQTYDY